MPKVHVPAARSARLRARVAAWAGGERGEALLEVLLAALMVALIAAATLNGYSSIAHISGTQRHRAEAAVLAQQDQARLRGLTIIQLAGSSGNQSTTQTIDGTTYTVTSLSKYVSGTSSNPACTTGPSFTTADQVATSSTVTWSPGNDNRAPVVVHGLVAPSEGGSLIVTAENQGATGLAGVTATVTGPTTVSPLTTDANGCSVFGGLAGGSYSVVFSDPGYVDVNGISPPATQTVTVIPTQTAHTATIQIGQAGTINATFTTKFNGSTVAATADQIVTHNNGITSGNRIFGTDSTASSNTYVSSLSTGATMFPFTTNYDIYAGGCAQSTLPSGSVSAAVTPGGTTNVTLTEPAMIVKVYNAASGSSPLITTVPDVTVTDNLCSNEDYPPEQVPTATQGALVNPGMPYGTYTVCADATISGTVYHNTATVANTNYTTGNVASIYLGTGAAGRSTGKCP